MEGLGRRLKDRARELGWSDAEVARRLDIAQTRYANYVTDRHEPDLKTLMQICGVLGIDVETLLGQEPAGSSSLDRMRRRIAAACQAMDEATLRLAVEVVDALAARPRPPAATGTTRKRSARTTVP